MRLRRLPAYLAVAGVLAACTGSSGPAPSTGPVASPAPSELPSAEPTPSPSVAAAPSPSASVPAPVRLTGDGIDLGTSVLVFGTPADRAVPALRARLGRPTRDTGVVSPFSEYGTCPGSKLRALEYGGRALVIFFGDVSGKQLTMYAWQLRRQGSPAAVPRARALIGDVTTFEFGVGTTVAALRAGVGSERLTVYPPEDPFPASYKVDDQSSGLSGYLTGTADGDTTNSVSAGRGCGE